MLKQKLEESRGQLAKFFDRYIGPNNRIRLIALDPEQQKKPAHVEGFGSMAGLINWAHARNLEGMNLYWVPNEIGVMHRAYMPKPAIGDMRAARFCWADADPDAALIAREGYSAARATLLGSDGFAARAWAVGALVIDSGNGIQAFFKLVDSVSLHIKQKRPNGEGWAEIEKSIARVYGNDSSVAEPSRIMRLPFAWNWPSAAKIAKGYSGEPRWSSVLAHAQKLFTLEELRALALSNGIDPSTVAAKVADESILMMRREITDFEREALDELAERITAWRDSPQSARLKAQFEGSHRDVDRVDSSGEDFDYAMTLYKFLRADIVEPQRSELTLLAFLASPCAKRIFQCGKKPDPQDYIRKTVAKAIMRRKDESGRNPPQAIPRPPVGRLITERAS